MARRWVAIVLVVGLVSACAGAAVGIATWQAGRQDLALQRFSTQQTTAARFIHAYTGQIQRQEQKLAIAQFAGSVTAAKFGQVITENQFTAAVLLDQSGRLLQVWPPNPALIGTQVGAKYPHLRTALGGEPAISGILSAAGSAPSVIGFAVPFDTPSGRRVFSGAHALSDTPLQPFVASSLSAYSTATVHLIDATETVVAATDPDQAGQRLQQISTPLAAALARTPSGFLPRGAGADQAGPTERASAYYLAGPVKGTPWRLVFTVETAELFKSLGGAQRWVPWAALGVFVLMGMLLIGRLLRYQARGTLQDQARQQSILDTAADAFVGIDAAGLVTDWNAAATRLLGWDAPEALARRVTDLVIPSGDLDANTGGLRQFLTTGTAILPTNPIIVTVTHRDGRHLPVELTLSRTPWKGSWRFHVFLRDITDRLEQEQQLRDLALTDSLTGLCNRRAFADRLAQTHARARRHGTAIGVLYADIDHFKAINDTYGHATGDAILVEVAERLRGQFRTEDTIGRLGGDEFAVVCEDIDPTAGDTLSRGLHRDLAAPYMIRGQILLATVSIGVTIDNASHSIEHLLEQADTAMYQAKATTKATTPMSRRDI